MFIYIKKNNLLKNYNQENIGSLFFYSGVFFLASAVGVSMLLFMISQFISFLKPSQFLKDKWNYPLFISAFLMGTSTFIHFLRYGLGGIGIRSVQYISEGSDFENCSSESHNQRRNSRTFAAAGKLRKKRQQDSVSDRGKRILRKCKCRSYSV